MNFYMKNLKELRDKLNEMEECGENLANYKFWGWDDGTVCTHRIYNPSEESISFSCDEVTLEELGFVKND